MEHVLTLETKKYEIRLENFEGPLDLLCHLVDKNKMDIYQVNISKITDQYIEYIQKMEDLKLEVTSEFLIMASTLLYIKSKGLLPSEVEEEAELTEEELVRRIIEYKKYKEITKTLKELYEINLKRFYKFPDQIELPKQTLEKRYKIQDIYSKYDTLWKRNEEKVNQNANNIERIRLSDRYTVASKVKQIFKELIKKPKFVFNKLFSLNQCTKEEVVTAFSGLLELTRRNKVTTSQEKTFGEITVERKGKNEILFSKEE